MLSSFSYENIDLFMRESLVSSLLYFIMLKILYHIFPNGVIVLKR